MARTLSGAARIARSGLVDREYYESQTGRRFPHRLAIALHFLREGAASGLSLHPLFEPAYLAQSDDAGEVMLDYLAHPGDYAERSPHPLFDPAHARRQLRDRGIKLKGNAWLSWVLSAEPGTALPAGKKSPKLRWSQVRGALVDAASRWRAGGSAESFAWSGAPTPDPGLTSIVAPVADDLAGALRQPTLTGGARTREAVVVGALTRAQFCCLTAVGLTRPVRPVLARGAGAGGPDLAELWNLGASHAGGAKLVFLAPGASIGAAAIATLAEALDDPATAVAQPLNEQPDMTIASAGALFLDDDPAPHPLLWGHPATDAEPLAQRSVQAAYSAVLAVRSDTFAALDGFDPAFGDHFAEVDLSLRAAARGLGHTTLVVDSRATVRSQLGPGDGRDAAAELLRRHGAPQPGSHKVLNACGFVLTSGRITRPRSGRAALPTLRWTIDTPVTAGWWAESWGDWHYAHSLARALRRLGQQVAVDTKAARGRDSRRLDDVLLTLRGTDEVRPAQAPVNLMWIIYAPEQVTAQEAARYDQVFASSVSWAQQRTAEWDLPIRPLLQCTDAELFYPRPGVHPADDVLFVGNARRGGTRPMVEAALAAGAELRLYGTGWDQIPAAAGRLTGLRVPNQELGLLYSGAGVVLNDHLETMRQAGFVSNRLFDAVACGARVLSDPVEGVADLFGDSVLCCDPSQVAEILAQPWESQWPSAETRLAHAERVLREHSFDQRAQVLLDAAVEVLDA